MLAMVAQAPRGIRQPALSLTTIATVRRLDEPAPTVRGAGIKKGSSKEPLGRSPPPGWGVRGKSKRNQVVVSELSALCQPTA